VGKVVIQIAWVRNQRLWRFLFLNLRILVVTCLAFSIAKESPHAAFRLAFMNVVMAELAWLCPEIIPAKSWIGELGLIESDLSA
jgi:hypothetical protein